MKVSRIQRIKNHRIFRDFTWPNTLGDFAAFNLIYGWNGSGKTTLSNVFRFLQTRHSIDPAEGEVEFRIDSTSVTGDALPTAALPQVRVFNRDAVDRSVFEMPNRQFPPVYFIGEDSVEKERRALVLKSRLHRVQARLADWESKRKAAENDFERYCTDQARQIKNLLTASGGGQYNNYDSRLFKQTATRLAITELQPQRLSDDQRLRLLATKDGMPKDKIQPLTVQYPDLAAITSNVQQMLQRSVLSSVLPELASSPEVAAWVGDGLRLHLGENATEKCRFCTQALPKHRMAQLQAHFNDEFKKFQSDIAAQISTIEDVKSRIGDLRPPSTGLLYPHLVPEYEKAIRTLSQQRSTVLMYFDVLNRALIAKKDEPFKELNFHAFLMGLGQPDENVHVLLRILEVVGGTAAAISAHLGYDAYQKVSVIITKHNAHTDNFSDEVNAARKALEQDTVIEGVQAYRDKQAEIDRADRRARQAKRICHRLSAGINALELSIQEHQRPAEELNREMASYLGRDELRFEVQRTGYTITRNGEPALNLSEGEKTAIAFMYFLKSLEDTGFDAKAGVVVIDDPVSSLDANSLYCAFGFMKARTREAHQLFVLTHNFTFFRQVRNWFLRRHRQERRAKPEQFYMLTSEPGADGKRSAALLPLDPLLHEFESEYHYLFKRVYDEANNVGAQRPLLSLYGLPNIARRLLEAFLAFRFPNGPGDLYCKLERVSFDVHKRTRMLRFLHTESHFDKIGDPEHDLSLLSETPVILKDILDLMRTTDSGHYDGMLEVVHPQPPNAG